MIVRSISYKRTKQTKRYEPEVIELIMDLQPGETVPEVIAKARNIVAKEFGEEPAPCSCKPDVLMNAGCSCGGG